MSSLGLSPRARALIEAERSATIPSVADRDRVAAALHSRLALTSSPLAGGSDWQCEPPSGCFLITDGSYRLP